MVDSGYPVAKLGGRVIVIQQFGEFSIAVSIVASYQSVGGVARVARPTPSDVPWMGPLVASNTTVESYCDTQPPSSPPQKN